MLKVSGLSPSTLGARAELCPDCFLVSSKQINEVLRSHQQSSRIPFLSLLANTRYFHCYLFHKGILTGVSGTQSFGFRFFND